MSASWTVRHVAETGSTNADLTRLVRTGEAVDRLVLRTDHQTAGRGRLDRRWAAPPGRNLLVSLLFLDPGDQAHELPQRIGLAAAAAIDGLAGGRLDGPVDGLGLKWPNDVIWRDEKLGGILAERATGPGGMAAVVVGLGLNVGWAPDGATCVAELLRTVAQDPAPVDPADVLERLLVAFDGLPGDPEALREMVRARLLTLGRRVRVELPGERTLAGTAVDLDADGRIVVRSDDDVRHVLDVGDVVHLRAT